MKNKLSHFLIFLWIFSPLFSGTSHEQGGKSLKEANVSAAMSLKLIDKGRLERKRGKLANARALVTKALEQAAATNRKDIQMLSYKELAIIDVKDHNNEQALLHYKKYRELYDLIFSEQTSRKMANLRTNLNRIIRERALELKRKERQVKILANKRSRLIKNLLIALPVLVLLLLVGRLIHTQLKLKNN